MNSPNWLRLSTIDHFADDLSTRKARKAAQTAREQAQRELDRETAEREHSIRAAILAQRGGYRPVPPIYEESGIDWSTVKLAPIFDDTNTAGTNSFIRVCRRACKNAIAARAARQLIDATDNSTQE